MEDLIFFSFCQLSLINIKIKGLNEYFKDYMDLENTSSIKGIFVWMIVFSHNRGYYPKNFKYFYFKILTCTGQKMVSLFLFYSGFGIIELIKKKGLLYVKSLPKKATILFIKYQLILLIFLINNIILGIKMNIKIYLLSIIFIKNLGNSNWFAFTIIHLYYYSFLSFIIIKNKSYIFISLIIMSIICYFHIFITYNYIYPKGLNTIDNILTFLIGMFYSLLKNNIDTFVMKNDILYFENVSLFLFIIYYFSRNKNHLLFRSLTNSFFSLIFVIISMKIRFNNEFLKLLNTHSYSIYLLQRIIMIIVYKRQLFKKNECIRFPFIFSCTLLISILFDRYTGFVNIIFNKNICKHKKNNLLLSKKNDILKEVKIIN